MSDPSSFSFESLRVSYTKDGTGPPLLMLHGSGPGASSLGNWRTVLGPLAEHYTVYAMDLIGFGQSDRRQEPPYFDYPMWLRQAQAMVSEIPSDGPIGVIGHSLSGSIALNLASFTRRIAAVMTTGTMGADFAPNEATNRTWRCPRTRDELRTAVSGLVHDQSLINDAYLAAREPVVFAPGYADYFDQMFEGDQRRYVRAAVLSQATLRSVTCPVLMLHGRDDTAFPTESTLTIASGLPQADVILLADCSHSVAFERRDVFLANATLFFNRAISAFAQ